MIQKFFFLYVVCLCLVIGNSFSQSVILDKTFNQTGRVTNRVGGLNEITSAELGSNGKIIVVGDGFFSDSCVMRLALLCYDSTGTIDMSFGINGFATDTFSDCREDVVRATTTQQDGKIILAGVSYRLSTNQYTRMFLERFFPDGTIDKTFGNSGRVLVDAGMDCSATGVAIQNDGKILVSTAFQNDSFRLIRYKNSGTVDSGFGMNGTGVPIQGSTAFDKGASKTVAIQPDGKIVTGGVWSSVLVRYNTNGTLDSSFGTNGVVTSKVFGWSPTIYSLQIQNDNKIVAVGSVSSSFLIARYNADGSYDNSFGYNGVIVKDINTQGAFSVGIQPDGKIIAAGTTYTSKYYNDFAMYRVMQNGDPDLAFGDRGLITTNFFSGDTSYDDYCSSIKLLPNGKLLLAGFGNNAFATPSHTQFSVCLARYTPGYDTISVDTAAYNLAIYPNPIGDKATLQFSLNTDENIEIQMTDVAGRKIAALVPFTTMKAGNHKTDLTFPAGLPKGVYFVTLRYANGKQQSVKVVK